MSLLDAVRWPALLSRSLSSADDHAREAAAHYATSRAVPPFFRRGVAFAMVVLANPSVPMLRIDITAVSSLDVDQADRVARWLLDTAPAVARIALSVVEERPSAPVPPGRLAVDADLPDLPLLPLAADLAARTGGLAVVAAELPPGINGLYVRGERAIRLDPRRDPAAHLPHELGHALDPHLGQRGAPALDERFAELLGGLLLDYLPASVAGAAEYIDFALSWVTSVQAEQAQHTEAAAGEVLELPAPGTESVLAFCALPLIGAQS